MSPCAVVGDDKVDEWIGRSVMSENEIGLVSETRLLERHLSDTLCPYLNTSSHQVIPYLSFFSTRIDVLGPAL